MTGPIGLPPLIKSSPAAVARLVADLSGTMDDGGAGLQQLVARLPLMLGVDRAYIARISSDGNRFAVTQTAQGEWPDLLGYTQSVGRMPAFVRGSLQTGIQAKIEDGALFPFTPQQRKMIWYTDLGATVVTPIPSARRIVGALVIDVFKENRAWDNSTLETCRTLASAVGTRLALAKLGDHLEAEDVNPDHDVLRLNVLSNIARLLERSSDPVQTTSSIVEELSNLDWVASARLAPVDDPAEVVRQALATEGIVVRSEGGSALVALPLRVDGEHFGAIELGLLGARLTDAQDQFLRSVQVFAGSAYANALRRAKPRDEALHDRLTGLMSYRSIHEVLVDAVHAGKSSGRPVSVWLVDIEGLGETNRSAGYATGDDVVAFVGHTLGGAVEPRGTAGRVGGGVFMVVLPSMAGEEAEVGARMLAERVARRAPGHLPKIGLTIGVSSFPAQAGTQEELERSARLALYAAKGTGAGAVVMARMRDDRWVREARGVFSRIVSEQQLPVSRDFA